MFLSKKNWTCWDDVIPGEEFLILITLITLAGVRDADLIMISSPEAS
jgi:hypothetical protein